MTQQRRTETKEKIKCAFTQLLKEKGMDALTVSDIARRSNINRGTFYLHYIDKYDLLEQLENKLIEDLTRILLKDNGTVNFNDPLSIIPYDCILDTLYYVKSDFEFVQALVGKGGDPFFVEKFKKILEQLIFSMVEKSDKLKFSLKGIPQDYANEILLASVTSIILLWMKKGGVESPEEIAEMLSKAKEISPYELLL